MNSLSLPLNPAKGFTVQASVGEDSRVLKVLVCVCLAESRIPPSGSAVIGQSFEKCLRLDFLSTNGFELTGNMGDIQLLRIDDPAASVTSFLNQFRFRLASCRRLSPS